MKYKVGDFFIENNDFGTHVYKVIQPPTKEYDLYKIQTLRFMLGHLIENSLAVYVEQETLDKLQHAETEQQVRMYTLLLNK